MKRDFKGRAGQIILTNPSYTLRNGKNNILKPRPTLMLPKQTELKTYQRHDAACFIYYKGNKPLDKVMVAQLWIHLVDNFIGEVLCFHQPTQLSSNLLVQQKRSHSFLPPRSPTPPPTPKEAAQPKRTSQTEKKNTPTSRLTSSLAARFGFWRQRRLSRLPSAQSRRFLTAPQLLAQPPPFRCRSRGAPVSRGSQQRTLALWSQFRPSRLIGSVG